MRLTMEYTSSMQALLRELEARRLALGMSRQAFATMLGMSPSYWTHVTAGRRRLGRGAVLRVKKVFPLLVTLEVLAEAKSKGWQN